MSHPLRTELERVSTHTRSVSFGCNERAITRLCGDEPTDRSVNGDGWLHVAAPFGLWAVAL